MQVGQGGFAEVSRAFQPRFSRRVAVKLLDPISDPLAIQRFVRECEAMGMLSSHPNIVTVFDAGLTNEGQPFLIMEYMPDGSLDDWLANDGPLPWTEVAEAGVKLAGALETAHEAAVLHRDVKPANVLRSRFGEPCLSDFGLARFADDPKTSGVVTATLLHAPPEIIDGRPASPQSDVYSLASTLFMLLAGDAPFWQPTDESLLAVIHRIATDPVPDLRGKGVPAALCEVIEDAMAKAPDDRPSSAAAFGSALRKAQQLAGVTPTDLPISGQESVRAARQAATSNTDPDLTIPRSDVPARRDDETEGPRTASERPAWRRFAPVLLGLLVVVAAAVVLVLVRAGDDGDTDTATPTATTATPTATTAPPTTSPVTTETPSGPSQSVEGVLLNVPAAYRPNCAPLDDLPTGATDGVRCFPETDADVVEYIAFDDVRAMQDHYLNEVDDGGVEPNTGIQCPPASEGGYQGAERGRLRCFVSDDGFANVQWTNEDLRVFTYGTRSDGDLDALYRWWFSASSGPVDPDAAP